MTTGRQRLVFPVGLLLEKSRCVVIGGGKVATKKVLGLLDARASITVVSPELDPALRILAQEGKIQHVHREFREQDTEGASLVFAATGSKTVNRSVLDSCRRFRVLCCPVDGNWIAGDFVTPATLRKGPLTVSISTGGQSCRRSRLIKNSLARHIDMVDSADFVVLGTSHHCLSLKDREPLHLRGSRFDEIGQMLMHVWGIHEFMLLNTCNRIELLAVKSHSAGAHELLRRVLGFDRLAPSQYYVKRGFDAFEHAALLTAGLLSQMPGENHIVSQVKEALDAATARGWAAGMMSEWMSAALHISKDIRRQMPASLGKHREIEDACIGFLKEAVPQSDARITVVGTGVVGQGVVQRLTALDRHCDWIYHSHKPSEGSIPSTVALRPWKDLPDSLGVADVAICATASAGPVLDKSAAGWFRNDKPVLLLDLATPRNIDPALAAALPNARLADLDSLKGWHWKATGSLDPILDLSRTTVREHREMYDKIIHSFQSRDESE